LTEKIATDIIQVYNLCAGTHLTQGYLQPVVQTNFLKFGIQTILWLVIHVYKLKFYKNYHYPSLKDHFRMEAVPSDNPDKRLREKYI
jgi:hypothetical protein